MAVGGNKRSGSGYATVGRSRSDTGRAGSFLCRPWPRRHSLVIYQAQAILCGVDGLQLAALRQHYFHSRRVAFFTNPVSAFYSFRAALDAQSVVRNNHSLVAAVLSSFHWALRRGPLCLLTSISFVSTRSITETRAVLLLST